MEKEIKLIRKKINNTKTKIIIGKEGLNENTVKNIKRIIEKEGFVKIKILKTYMGNNTREEIFQKIAKGCNAKIAFTVGYTVILTK